MPGSADRSPLDAVPPPVETVRVQDVSRRFGALIAVREVSFRIGAGGIVGLVGSDGAGKTTLLRMIAGMLAPSAGRVAVAGRDTVAERGAVKELVGYMPQRFGLYPDLSVAENFDFVMDIYGVAGPERARRRERYLGFSNLLPFLERRAGDLSGGMKQKLGLACVLVHEPRVLILDEPTNGVDPVSRREFWQILAEMKQAGMTLVVSTAYLDEGERCDRLLLMHDARVIADGTPAGIRAELPSLEEAIIRRIQAVDSALAEDAFGR
jgi:ABC-2 type transport system ATP-binding protein